MNKKLVISKTILFVVIVAFIIAFKTIFGDENTLIGVTTVTALLMLLERDLTLSPVKSTFKLIGLNVFIGIAAMLANINVWVAIPVNFITIFILSYSLCYNLKKPIYLPFSLQYLFILVNPVGWDKIPMRFLSLIVGAVIIMAAQLIVNRNNVLKKGNVLLAKACDGMIEKLKLARLGEVDNNLDNAIKQDLNSFRKIIYNKREENFYLTEESKIKLNISVALEKIYILLEKLEYESDNEKLLDELAISLTKVKQCLQNERSIEDTLKETVNLYEENHTEDIVALEIINNIVFIYECLEDINELDEKHYNLIKRIEEIPENFKQSYVNKRNFKLKSAKFSYAVRVAVGITIGGFIMDYFHLTEGRWIMFTVLSLVNPLYEVSKEKTKDRIIATIIGAFILEILFGIFGGVSERTIILMLAGYIGSYMTKYRYNMICVTVSAIGAASILGNTDVMIQYRILFVIIGAIIAISINKIVMPYNLEKDTKHLKNMYKDVINEMIDDLPGAYKDVNGDKINNLFIVTTLIEERLKANNVNSDNNISAFIEGERNLVCSIYELYIRLSKPEISNNTKLICSELKKINEDNLGKYTSKIKEYIHISDNINEKLVLSNIMEIILGINEMKKLPI